MTNRRARHKIRPMPSLCRTFAPLFFTVVAFTPAIAARGQAFIHAASDPSAYIERAQLPEAPVPPPSHPMPTGEDGLPLDRQVHPPVTVLRAPVYVVQDLAHIAVSPKYIRVRDLKWLVPLTAAAAAGFATDQKTMTEVVSNNPSFNSSAGTASDVLRDGLMAAPVLMFGAGHVLHNDHARETGILATEAYIDAFIVDEVVKLGSFRERPLARNHEGDFYIANAGVDSSFVSGHTMIAWASAAAIAGEYHSKWVQLGAYSAATGVGLTRVMAQQHFPTDVLLASAGGWLIGHYVIRAHHHSDVHPLR